MQKSKTGIIQWQRPMKLVIYALIPVTLASVYFFGLRSLLLLAVVNLTGFVCEFIFSRYFKQKVTSAIFVTNFLFALSLPPNIPIWIAIIGIVFGVVFGKMVFGGFGKNIFNPALSGRAFIYVSFGIPMTSQWFEPVTGPFGGFNVFSPDVVSHATPIEQLSAGQDVSYLNLLLGNTSGSLGETCAILILVCGIFLIITKTANYRIIVSGTAAFLLLQAILWGVNITVINPLAALLCGSFLFGIMFMATDPVSASQTTNTGRWIYGAFIGIMTVLIRVFSAWPEGITFSILLANTFAPLLDHAIKEVKKSKRGLKA
jgi:Na+-transporting NADH:ubiquinone oxidoreductase subunit B